LAEILNDEGIHIARRTVAKYREHLKIPIARLRREFK
jgi:RNA polymerase sigma-54 factor